MNTSGKTKTKAKTKTKTKTKTKMTDEHIRIIVQTSQKDGIENQHVKKVEN